jgi:hypothetical protein
MPRWSEIILTLVLFAAGMAVLTWAVNASVPVGIDWLWERIGGAASWGVFLLIMVICAYFAWRGHRPRKGSAGRLEGR